jgi:hypothetical protein
MFQSSRRHGPKFPFHSPPSERQHGDVATVAGR